MGNIQYPVSSIQCLKGQLQPKALQCQQGILPCRKPCGELSLVNPKSRLSEEAADQRRRMQPRGLRRPQRFGTRHLASPEPRAPPAAGEYKVHEYKVQEERRRIHSQDTSELRSVAAATDTAAGPARGSLLSGARRSWWPFAHAPALAEASRGPQPRRGQVPEQAERACPAAWTARRASTTERVSRRAASEPRGTLRPR